jgi:hypothetical protein
MSTPLLNWEDKINSPELKAFFEQFGLKYYLSAEQINELRDAMNALFSQNNTIPSSGRFVLVQKLSNGLNNNIEMGDLTRGIGPGTGVDFEYWNLAQYLNLTGDGDINNYLNHKPINVSLPNS